MAKDTNTDVPPFPMETLRHWYVTPFGGHSNELSFYQVGIRRSGIEANTELDPAVDRVRIGLLGRRHARPFLMDRPFEIVPLDESRPDSLSKSPRGEAVLPEGDEVVRRPFPLPRPGDSVVLNGVAARRFLNDPERLAKVLEAVFEEGFGRRPAS
ncbi:MAG TPA: hypothetical protein VJ207_06405 [Thermoplasmata archaeon]|nr:hypothetical protein [Thermoplasmata archaeon]